MLDVSFDREAIREFGAEGNLAAFMVKFGGRYDLNSSGGLKRIKPPSWLGYDDYKDFGKLE